jgi:hypothetical protein
MRLIRTARAAVTARLPRRGNAAGDAARQEQRRAIAAFLAAPHAPRIPRDLCHADGLSGTPGIGEALAGHALAFADDHAGAAEAFWRAARAIPDIADDSSDVTRQQRLAKALALMLLARQAVRAGLDEVRWTGLGTATDIAAAAVALQPLLLHLRFEHAELLRARGDTTDALDVLTAAWPIAADQGARYRIGDAAGEIASQSRNLAAIARAERDFITPLLAPGRDDGPPDPAEGEREARSWAWVLAFRAGKLSHTTATLATEEVERARLADLAARRFGRSLALMDLSADPVRPDDRANLGDWRRITLRMAAEAALTTHMPLAAARRLRWCGEAEDIAMADRLRGWVRAGRPARFAALSLLTPPPGTDHEAGPDARAEGIAVAALARAAAPWRDEHAVALPKPADALAVIASDAVLTGDALARRVIGTQDDAAGPAEDEVSILGLRTRLGRRFLVTLPGVNMGNRPDATAPGAIAVLLHGQEVLGLAVPADARLALSPTAVVAHAGLTPLPHPAPSVGGVACCWIGEGATPVPTTIRVLPPAFAIVGALETAMLRALPRLVGLDEAAAILPELPPAMLPDALVALRLLLRERTPIGSAPIPHWLRARLEAGDAPAEAALRLRATPAVARLLWGNEAGRVTVTLPGRIAAAIARADTARVPRALATLVSEAALAAIAGKAAPVLVVDSDAVRRRVRAALADTLPDLPILTDAERSARG